MHRVILIACEWDPVLLSSLPFSQAVDNLSKSYHQKRTQRAKAYASAGHCQTCLGAGFERIREENGKAVWLSVVVEALEEACYGAVAKVF